MIDEEFMSTPTPTHTNRSLLYIFELYTNSEGRVHKCHGLNTNSSLIILTPQFRRGEDMERVRNLLLNQQTIFPIVLGSI